MPKGSASSPQPPGTPLLFGDHQSERHHSPHSFAARLAQWLPAAVHCSAAPGVPFAGRGTSIELPGLRLTATAATASRLDIARRGRACLLIALRGQAQARLGDRLLAWGAGDACLYLPGDAGAVQLQGEGGDVLMIGLDPGALRFAARAMLGLAPGQPIDLALDGARALQVPTAAGAPVEGLARHIGRTIDLYQQDAHTLHRLGFQDFVYRQLVPLFCPDWRAAAGPERPHKRRAIDHVCDALLDDLSARSTLSDMATLGRMSVRALQYAFQSRFGMSPVEWLREQRLLHARQRLQAGDPASIALLAQECGFGTSSQFAAFYRQRFGEAPSATRGSARSAR